ncbi:MAG TPA: hypothetical protein PLZ36_04635 [Armatimonadota bacterium]|nr:hypothetical protein [Armatimonadota bacterium]
MRLYHIVVPVLLLAGVICLANPIAAPDIFQAGHSGLGIGVIVFALFVEAGVNAFMLLFASMNFGAVFLALALSNVLIYPLIFFPLHGMIGIWPAEAVIFLLDAGIILWLGGREAMQGDGFVRLRWQHAVLASFFGNLASYFIGQWGVGRSIEVFGA